nr:MAG TPA: hypothetical protein [Caudoviricetes sp.]
MLQIMHHNTHHRLLSYFHIFLLVYLLLLVHFL